MKICNGSDGEESILRRFSLEKTLGIRERQAASHVNSQWLVNPRRILAQKTQEGEPQSAFSWKKYRIWEGSATSQINLQSHRTQDAFYLRKHMESERVADTRFP